MRGMSRVSKRGLELLVLLDMRVYTYTTCGNLLFSSLPPSSFSLSLFSRAHVYVRDPQLHAYVHEWISRYICGRGVYRRGCGGNIRVSGAESLCRYGNGFSKTRSRWKKDGTMKKDTFFTGAQSGGSVMSLELHDITIKIPVCFPLGEVLMSCRGISKRIWRCDGGEPLSWRCWRCLR